MNSSPKKRSDGGRRAAGSPKVVQLFDTATGQEACTLRLK
jgi:hypothetical protein